MSTPPNRPAAGNRWVPTFASDVRPRDQVRCDGQEGRVVGRDARDTTLRLHYDDGTTSRPIAHQTIVSIWDPDGSVAERVASLSAAAVIGHGARQRSAGA